MKGPRQDTKLPVFRCNGVTVHTVIVLCSKSIVLSHAYITMISLIHGRLYESRPRSIH